MNTPSPIPTQRTRGAKLCSILTSAAAALVFATTSMAATASFTSTLPTSDILLQNSSLSSTANLQLRNIGTTATNNTRWVGVGFTAPSTSVTLDKATFYVAFDTNNNGLVAATALGATIQIDVVSLSSLTASPGAPYTVIYSETSTVPLTYSNQAFMTFDFSTPVALTANQNYGIVLSFVDNASGRGINFRQSPGGTAGTNSIGNTFFSGNQGSTWTTNSPLAFVLQTTPSSIPEPSTYAVVFGLVVLGLVAIRRHSRID